VADIQGVGDLFTDPQVLSSDYRFGDGDLGPRGMALFFKSFRHCGISDALGIPIFPLSRNELKVQVKYDEDEETISDEGSMSMQSHDGLNKFQRLDQNRMKRRSSVQQFPRHILGLGGEEGGVCVAGVDEADRPTVTRANLGTRPEISRLFRNSILKQKAMSPPRLRRTKSDVDEVEQCLQRALQDRRFSLHHDFHRDESGELRQRHFRNQGSFHKSNKVRGVSTPMMPSEETKQNLGKVHYQMAVLHGIGRFPDVIPDDHKDTNKEGEQKNCGGGSPDSRAPHHDSFSVLFHLSHAASLQNVPACLALARVQAGLDTVVSDLLRLIVPTDFERAKDMLERAMASPYSSPAAPQVAAGTLLFQILHDETSLLNESYVDVDDDESEAKRSSPAKSTLSNDARMIQVTTETLKLFDAMEAEDLELEKHKNSVRYGGGGGFFCVGDRVEANYCLEGSYYPGSVVEVAEDRRVTVQYDDDGSNETLSKENVRLLIPPTATQTNLGGPLSDEEAFGTENSDSGPLLSRYELQVELAELKERACDRKSASELYQDAADRALNDGKMQLATKWSLKAAELLE